MADKRKASEFPLQRRLRLRPPAVEGLLNTPPITPTLARTTVSTAAARAGVAAAAARAAPFAGSVSPPDRTPSAASTSGEHFSSPISIIGPTAYPIHIIANWLADHRQLSSLAKLSATCRVMYYSFLPALYRRINLTEKSARLFHDLVDEVVCAHVMTERDQYIMYPLFRVPRPFRLHPMTPARVRFGLVHTVTIEGGIDALVRSPEDLGLQWRRPSHTRTAIPALCPQLRAIVVSKRLLESYRQFEILANPYEKARRMVLLARVCHALEALLQPNTVIYHLPKYKTKDAYNSSESLFAVIRMFEANEIRGRAQVFLDTPIIPLVALRGTSDIHLCLTRGMDVRAQALAAVDALAFAVKHLDDYFGRIVVYEHLTFQHRLCRDQVYDYPYKIMAEMHFQNEDNVEKPVPEGLSPLYLDRIAQLHWQGNFVLQVWNLACTLVSRKALRTWTPKDNIYFDFFPWAEFFDVLQHRFARLCIMPEFCPKY